MVLNQAEPMQTRPGKEPETEEAENRLEERRKRDLEGSTEDLSVKKVNNDDAPPA